MSQKTKITLTAIISIVVTFVFTCAMCLFLAKPILSFVGGIGESKSSTVNGGALLGEVKAYLDNFYMGEIDEDELYYHAAKGMAASTGDIYTNYYTPEEFSAYMDETTGQYVGVGLVISATTDTNEIIVVLPYEGAPGAKAGVLPGDIITAVDGSAVNGDMLDETADLMRGKNIEKPKGTQVTLTLVRNGSEPFDVVLTREEVHLKTVSSKMLEGDIGYVRIISFDSDTDKELETELNSLFKSGMKKLILDLRDNGGGDFNTAIRCAGKFLDEKSLVVYTQNKNGKRQDFYALGKISDNEMIVLINAGSASASEVLTGALKGNNRLKNIVGTKSYGKGITQNIFQLRNGGGMSITVDKYYTPTDECIHEKGIEPDVAISLGENDKVPSTTLSYEQDLQLQKAVELFK